MQNISIRRFNLDTDGPAQTTEGRVPEGVIEPADQRWKMIIDDHGDPHVWIRASYQDFENGPKKHGWVPLSEFIERHDGKRQGLADLLDMDSGHEQLTEEQMDAAYAEYCANPPAEAVCPGSLPE